MLWVVVELAVGELDRLHERIAGRFARAEPRASVHGHTLIDRELYLPQSWTDDPDRCREAGIPDETEFASKPRLAQAMISRALAAGVPFAWFTVDEAYGQARWLHRWLESRDVSYVMAIRRSDTLTMSAGERRADALIAGVPARPWQKISAGAGAHGPREYQARISRYKRRGGFVRVMWDLALISFAP